MNLETILKSTPPKKLAAWFILFAFWVALTVLCWPLGVGLLLVLALGWAVVTLCFPDGF